MLGALAWLSAEHGRGFEISACGAACHLVKEAPLPSLVRLTVSQHRQPPPPIPGPLGPSLSRPVLCLLFQFSPRRPLPPPPPQPPLFQSRAQPLISKLGMQL